ncbi:MAG: Gfo/Idh/MocA family oxidoreductase [Nitrospirae bacterium]|nr:Gfo/Idh/MocA family oxidoreductase [Nitrospirota bacterium]
MNNKIKVAVIGVGYLGEHHARIYSSMNDVDLVGVVDSNKARADEMAAKYSARAYYDYRELPGDVKAASIVVPTVLHHKTALDFIRRNIDVLIEKPVTTTIEEADDLIKEAQKRGVILQVGHVERFNSAYKHMQKQITRPGFIETHRLGPYVGRGIDVDVILDLMIHDIDIILSIVRSGVVDIKAIGVPVLTNSIDMANARLEFSNGCVANLTASRVSRERVRKIRIFQPDTYITLDYAQQGMGIYRRIIEDNKVKISSDDIKLEKEDSLSAELASFINAVRNRSTPAVSGEDGREALRIAIKIREDAEKRLSASQI